MLIRRCAGLGAVAAVAIAGAALPIHAASPQDGEGPMPQMMGHQMSGDDQMPAMMMQHQTMPMAGMHGQRSAATMPALPGQDAFGAIQEIVRILEADPKTDWSKVNLEALRQHLIDMNEVTLRADAAPKPIDGGIEVAVTGAGRTVEAIQRMVPAHAHEIAQARLNGWSAKTAPLPNGVLLTVTAASPGEVEHIRGLGFIGIMASGRHHQPHHLAMARGEMTH
jgi:hypothetical protein